MGDVSILVIDVWIVRLQAIAHTNHLVFQRAFRNVTSVRVEERFEEVHDRGVVDDCGRRRLDYLKIFQHHLIRIDGDVKIVGVVAYGCWHVSYLCRVLQSATFGGHRAS